MVEESSDYVLRRGLGVRGSHYLNDGKKDFGFHHSALESKNLPQSAPHSLYFVCFCKTHIHKIQKIVYAVILYNLEYII